MHRSSQTREQPLGRRPIHDTAMSAAERQRRRRRRLRSEPWRDPRRALRAIVEALRDLQGDEDETAALPPETVALIADRAVAILAPDDEAASAEARALVAQLLDPATPLPARGHRERRGRRGHRLGDRRRARHGGERAQPDADDDGAPNGN